MAQNIKIMDKREAHLVSTALSAVSDRLRMKGDQTTADILKAASEKMADADQVHIVHRIATA